MSEENLPTTVGPAPDWLVEAAEEDDQSLVEVRKHRKLARLKIVQGSTARAQAMKKEYGEGAVITVPQRARIAGPKEDFQFVPLFMYTEWCEWSDNDDQTTPAILSRTFDEASEVAQKAKDKKRREEEYEVGGKRYKKRFIEHLCFPGVIYGGQFHGTPVTLSFERGEYWQGENFCGAIMMQKIGQHTAPLWTQVWTLRSGDGDTGHKNDQFSWWGFDYATPRMDDREHGPFILEEEHDGFKQLAKELREKFAEGALEVDRSDADEETIEPGEDL